jgi:hypothetical protein
VNEGHLVCDSPEWRAAVRDQIIPWAVGAVVQALQLTRTTARGPIHGA